MLQWKPAEALVNVIYHILPPDRGSLHSTLSKIVNDFLGEAAKHLCARFQKQHHSARPTAAPASYCCIHCLRTCRGVSESIALRNRRRSQHEEKDCTRYYLPAISLLALPGTAHTHTWISEACQECNGASSQGDGSSR